MTPARYAKSSSWDHPNSSGPSTRYPYNQGDTGRGFPDRQEPLCSDDRAWRSDSISSSTALSRRARPRSCGRVRAISRRRRAWSLFTRRNGSNRLAADSAFDPWTSQRAMSRPAEVFCGSSQLPQWSMRMSLRLRWARAGPRPLSSHSRGEQFRASCRRESP